MDPTPLTAEQGRLLLDAVWETVQSQVVGRRPAGPAVPLAGPLGELRGHFVTLRVDGDLRGCIGTFHPEAPLAQAVARTAVNSLNDPRFVSWRPVRPDELGRLSIELSVLSPMWRSADPLAELVPGVHGLLVRHGGRSGCFLPQVATEMGWDGERMLSECCAGKAGMPADAWRKGDCEVYLFTAQIFDRPAASATPPGRSSR